MKKPTQYYTPGTWEPLNGHLPDGIHAGDVDMFATWLATLRMPIPAGIGAAMNDQTYTELIHVPQYCEQLGFLILAGGSGNLDISCSDDAYEMRIKVNSLDTNGSTRDEATWHQVNTPIGNVSSDTLNRTLELTDQAYPHIVTVELDVPSGVYLWEVVPFFLPRSLESDLPALFAESVPVAYWNMEDGSGSTVSDVSSAGNNLDGTKASDTVGQPLWDTSTSVYGSTSLVFDYADDDAVIVPDDAALDFSTDDAFSISCWIKRASSNSGTTVGIVSKMAQSSAVDSPFEGYALWFNDTDQRRLAFLLYRNVSGLQQLRVQTTDLAFGSSDTDWHHVLVTYNGNSDLSGVTMYVDGASVAIELQSADTLPSGADITTDTDMCFGGLIGIASTNSRIWPFSGNMDEVAIWSKELSANEVAAVWNGGNGNDLTEGIPSA